LEGQQAKNEINAEKYSRDIDNYIVKMKMLNNLMVMFGVTLRTNNESEPPKDL
jgi:hypothetical protein